MMPYFTAPPALRARVRALLADTQDAAPARSRPARDRWRWLTGGAFAGCTATKLAWVLGTAIIDWRTNDDLATEVVGSHVRATLGNHLIEVASSDQHTVKPWLSARLDYSPPVHDLANEGFALMGVGLMCSNGGRSRRLSTAIANTRLTSLCCPELAYAPPPALRTVRGFNVAHAKWLRNGLARRIRRQRRRLGSVRPAASGRSGIPP